MPDPANLENFIPFRRAALTRQCADEGRLDGDDTDRFRQLSKLVAALYHHEFHERFERIADGFSPFDPDRDTRAVRDLTPEEREEGLAVLVRELEEVLVRANYEKVSEADIERALEAKSLIALDLSVDFDDFADMLLFRRGAKRRTVEIKKGLPLLKKSVPFEMTVFDRVVLLLRYKDAEHFRKQGLDPEKLPFVPGRLYLQLFKDIPRADLEFLFPNMKAGLNLRQKLFIMIPAVGAGIPVLMKVAFTIGAVFAALGVFFGLREDPGGREMAAAVVGLTALAALGGYLFKQYAKYRSTLTRFLKGVTEQLFFKNLDSNSGVFRTVIDEAEEEEGKEAVLAYYHLLTGGPASSDDLDRRIESWFEKSFDVKLDFEVDDALDKLERLGLVTTGEGGAHEALPLPDALRVVDGIWDGLYAFD